VSPTNAAAGAVQLLGGVCAAPLLPGLIQMLKARGQGRPGPPVTQPYRELARLWRKTRVNPSPHTVVYDLAPVVVAALSLLAVLMVPVGGLSPAWPVGHDALLLVGLLALSPVALALAAWDTGGGFGLMGAARELAIAVSAAALLMLTLLLLEVGAGSTSLLALSAAMVNSQVWDQPAHWAAAIGLVLIVLVETGRQPIDNPDTHLELTMIHEGPLLEYAGPDLAYLQWATAARHWILLVLATELLLPQPTSFLGRLLELAVALPLWCAGIALAEVTQAKMRLLQVPLLLGAGGAVCTLGLASWLAGAHG
jgi:formate hydrogenlyase subunit 4